MQFPWCIVLSYETYVWRAADYSPEIGYSLGRQLHECFNLVDTIKADLFV